MVRRVWNGIGTGIKGRELEIENIHGKETYLSILSLASRYKDIFQYNYDWVPPKLLPWNFYAQLACLPCR
jgi:hypothetical protein